MVLCRYMQIILVNASLSACLKYNNKPVTFTRLHVQLAYTMALWGPAYV